MAQVASYRFKALDYMVLRVLGSNFYCQTYRLSTIKPLNNVEQKRATNKYSAAIPHKGLYKKNKHQARHNSDPNPDLDIRGV